MKQYLLLFVCLAISLTWGGAAQAWVEIPVEDDPLVRMPGTQPDETLQNIASPSTEVVGGEDPEVTPCNDCHKGDPVAPSDQGMPFFQWQGSMMAQAARDPIFWATMTVAAQDSIWAVGTPNATDICLRCHFPEGWMGGRSSDGLNASAMTGSDFDGVHCAVCHRMYDPFFNTAETREGVPSAYLDEYWDEVFGYDYSTPINTTYNANAALAGTLTYMNDSPLYEANNPKEPGYTENGGGQIFIDLVSDPFTNMRGPFADAEADHGMFYSRYHKSKFFCSTCHDVSNPVLANLGDNPADGLLSEQQSAHSYSHVERTFSEFKSSLYARFMDVPTNQEFQDLGGPATASTCQDCHMPRVPGNVLAADGGLSRPVESEAHPNSHVPAHDLQGGNLWITRILASVADSLDEYDPTNADLLLDRAAELTLDFTQGHGLGADKFGEALLASSERAKNQLLRAATIKNLTFNPVTGELSFRVQNNTGHKLLSGYPEGRRAFVNVKAYSNDNIVYEINPYDSAGGTFKGGLSFWNYNGALAGTGYVVPAPAALGPNEEHNDDLIYEAVTRSGLTGEDHTFHFALATDRYKDNRIPPKGFDLAEAKTRLSEPVAPGGIKDDAATVDTNLYTPAEYAGGYDAVSLTIPGAAAKNITHVTVTLYYQGTSREYIEFLRDEINGTGTNRALFEPTYAQANGLNPDDDPAYLIQNDQDYPFFTGLKAWGSTIWELWAHNHGLDGSGTSVDGIVPFAMTSAPVPAPGVALYTLQLIGDGTGYIEDIPTGNILCDKTSSAQAECILPYAEGSAISIRAVARAGSMFDGFTGDAVINGNELSDTVNENETVQAAFNLRRGMNIVLMTAISIAAEKGRSD